MVNKEKELFFEKNGDAVEDRSKYTVYFDKYMKPVWVGLTKDSNEINEEVCDKVQFGVEFGDRELIEIREKVMGDMLWNKQ